MLKLELDWAADDAPETGVVARDDEGDVLTVVAYDDAPGPAGWPTVVVIVTRTSSYVERYREAMAMDAWLRDEYGCDDDEQRQDLLDAAIVA